MNKKTINIDNIKRFTDQSFDRDNDKVARITKGILSAKSSRISDISSVFGFIIIFNRFINRRHDTGKAEIIFRFTYIT